MSASVYSTFLQALHVMNVALEENRSSTLFQLMLSACSAGMEGEHLVVEVYGDSPDDILDTFTITFKNSKFLLVKHGREGEDSAWKVSFAYLKDVAANAAKYLEHPSLLSFDWLRDRLSAVWNQSRPPPRQRKAST